MKNKLRFKDLRKSYFRKREGGWWVEIEREGGVFFVEGIINLKVWN